MPYGRLARLGIPPGGMPRAVRLSKRHRVMGQASSEARLSLFGCVAGHPPVRLTFPKPQSAGGPGTVSPGVWGSGRSSGSRSSGRLSDEPGTGGTAAKAGKADSGMSLSDPWRSCSLATSHQPSANHRQASLAKYVRIISAPARRMLVRISSATRCSSIQPFAAAALTMAYSPLTL